MQPAFQPRQIAGFMELFAGETETFIKHAREAADEEQVLDVSEEMNALTFRIIGQAICGTDVSGTAQTMARGMEIAMTEILYKIYTPLRIPDFIPTRSQSSLRRRCCNDERNCKRYN